MRDETDRKARPITAHEFAFVWGLAEATLFFIVPDVLLTWIALDRFRRALVATLFALAGALAGGTIMYVSGNAAPDWTRDLVLAQPGVDSAMLDDVEAQLEVRGRTALFIGPLTGRPYKVYAREAGRSGIGLAGFLAISVPARLLRFIATVGLAAFLSQVVLKRLRLRVRRIILVVVWVTFYTWFYWP